MNETIETLYNNLDNKDKIINEQALEIARLNEINENKQKEIDKLVCIIYKAIDDLLDERNNFYQSLLDIKEYIELLITDKDDEQCYPISWYSKDVILGMINKVLGDKENEI